MSRGRPPVAAEIAKSADHKVFITESEKAIAKLMPVLVGKSGSDFIREGYLINLKAVINENPELKAHIETELKKAGLTMPLYLKG